MNVYVVRSGVRIAPFGDLAGDLPVGGVLLRQWIAQVFEAESLAVTEVSDISEIPITQDRIITFDHVYLTRRVVRDFLKKWSSHKAPARVALPADSAYIRGFSDLQDFEIQGENACFDVFALPAGTASGPVEELRSKCNPLRVVYRDILFNVPIPKRVMGIDEWKHPVTSSVVVHVRHWLPLLHANLLAIQVRWVQEVLSHPLWAISLVLRSLFPGKGRLIWRLAGRANRIGRNVDIHPTARVEGSIIEDDVVIGAGALVRGSIIGKGVVLEPRVDIFGSVIGAGCFVSKHSIVHACASMEDSDICMKGMQMCLVGRKAALTARATPIDLAPSGRRHRVQDGAELREITIPLLGSCYGHESFIGADVYVGAGRAIPNGVRIGPRADRILSKLPAALEAGKSYVVVDGEAREP